MFVTLFFCVAKNKLKTNRAENSWKFKNSQPQPKTYCGIDCTAVLFNQNKIYWFLQKMCIWRNWRCQIFYKLH